MLKLQQLQKEHRQIESTSLKGALGGIDTTRVCRTCAHQTNRTWGVSLDDIEVRMNAGEKLDDIKCHPHRNEIPVEIRTGGPRKNISSGDRLHHEFSSCGQAILPKCRGCARFEPIRVRIPFVQDGTIFYVKEVSASGETVYVPKGRKRITPTNEDPYTIEVEPQWWNATVGGFCQIPAEGIIKDGRRTYCDPKPKKLRIENFACGNCEFLDWTDESTQFDGEVNGAARLSRYERFQIVQNSEPGEVGLNLGMALWRKQTKPQGRITWHIVNILGVEIRSGRKWYAIQTTENSRKRVKVSDGDERFEVFPNKDGKTAALAVRYPAHKLLDLPLPLRKKVRVWPALPPKKIRYSTRVPNLAKKDCDNCKPERSKITRVDGKLKIRIHHAEPCYYHSKAPVEHPLTGEIRFTHLCDVSKVDELQPQAILKIISLADGKLQVVDGNGHVPQPYGTDVANAAVFRQQVKSLVDSARRMAGDSGAEQVYKQYLDVISRLRFSYRTIPMRPSWLVPSSVEPNKPFCSHPDGINFRKAWQDAFGSERVDRRFDEGDYNKTQVEEELRAGYRDHNLTPQRLQEEILATELAHKFYDASVSGIRIPEELKVPEPESWTRVEIRGIGGMCDSGGNPITDPSEFVRSLDERVRIGHVPGEEGAEGPRYLTRRQQLFGYTVTRGRFGKRKGSDKTAMSALDPDYIIFGYNPDEDEHFVNDAWYCPECKTAHVDVEDPMDPICESCDSPLYRNQRIVSHNPRAAGGIGVAISTDSARTQQQHRLWSQVCPNWTLRNSNPPIGIDDLEGFDEDEPVMKHWVNRDHLRAKELDVEVGQLTEEHKAANAKFMEALREVEAKREAHKRSNEGVTAQELEQMFPTPKLPFYKEKIAGSVSKMGGSASSE